MWLWNTLKERHGEVHQGGGCLKEDKARLIFSHLSSAVHFLHQRRVTHCDIKLENILLDELGQVKLCDFRFDTQFVEGQMLQNLWGSLPYWATEIIKGNHTMVWQGTCGAWTLFSMPW